jgi:hypothetical protein
MRGFLRAIAIFIALLMSSAAATAEDTYPSRPVHILVPYPAGGGVDIVARSLGDKLSKHWGQPVVIENRPGAGGVIASQAVATSPKDGYMLIVVASGHATNPFLYAHLPYDTFKDFTPISLLGSSPNILLVRADSPFKTLADLLAEARKKPGSLSYGHAGNGTSTYLAGELLKSLAKVDLTGIPYKRCTGDQRLARWPSADLVQQRAGIIGPNHQWHIACAGGDDGNSRTVPTERADHGRGRRAGLRHRGMVGSARTEQYAGQRYRQDRQGYGRSDEVPSDQGSPHQARRDLYRQLASGIRQAHQIRLRQMGANH